MARNNRTRNRPDSLWPIALIIVGVIAFMLLSPVVEWMTAPGWSPRSQMFDTVFNVLSWVTIFALVVWVITFAANRTVSVFARWQEATGRATPANASPSRGIIGIVADTATALFSKTPAKAIREARLLDERIEATRAQRLKNEAYRASTEQQMELRRLKEEATDDDDSDDIVIRDNPLHDVGDAWKTSKPLKLVLGENMADPNGQLVYWDPTGTGPHVRIHGETGSGKSALTVGLIAQMLKHGWQVIIIDRRGFKDYKQFNGAAQLVDSKDDPGIILDVLTEIEGIHNSRDRLVASNNASDIRGVRGKVLKRICVVIDELTAQMNIADRHGIKADINELLETLTAEARSSGIHFLFCDQKPMNKTWGSIMQANVGTALMGYMPKGQAKTTTGSDMGNMLDGHKFYYERHDTFVKGWDCADLTRHLATIGQYRALEAPIVGIANQPEVNALVSAIEDDDRLTPSQKAILVYETRNPTSTASETADALGLKKATVKRSRTSARKLGYTG